jgi:hypothetical protein
MFAAFRNSNFIAVPKSECVYWSGSPLAAGAAMAVAHDLGLSGHIELDRTTEASSGMTWMVVHDTLHSVGSLLALLPTA